LSTYNIRGVEHVYDAFDEYEHANELPLLEVSASSLDAALERGREVLQARVNEQRRRGGFLSSGMFIAEVAEVLDESGKIVYPPAPVVFEAPPRIESVRAVSEELFSRLDEYPEDRFRLHPRLFEEVVAELLSRMGYSVRLTPYVADHGCDILASIGTPAAPILMLVECKRYAAHRPVGVEAVTRVWFRLYDDLANVGMLITTGIFQPVARRAAASRGYQLSLKDGEDFMEWVRSLKR